MKKEANQRGFTLIELMISLALTVMLLYGVSGILASSLQLWKFNGGKMEIQQTARYAVDCIVRDLQYAWKIDIISPTSLTLKTNQYGEKTKTITYTLDTSGPSYKLRRNQGDGSGAQPVTGDNIINASISNLKLTSLATNQSGETKTVGIRLTVTDISQTDPDKRQTYTIVTAVTANNVP
jgi:prepilin-type N-terminal cleavage/methylation domain-containing protein